ncbi:MAG: DUF5320 domain-containing protein [Candidatus Diapherotrites archaeon]|nr:DUF5320 domain-containing protein [Candidatus Diapherotrites archaeon]
MGYGCCSGGGFEMDRKYISKDEKIEMLKEYKESLEKEIEGVKERMKELEKG